MKIDFVVTQVVSRRPVISRFVFDPRLGYVGFVADDVAMGKVFLRVFRCRPAFVMP
jgi:hypothetical protein